MSRYQMDKGARGERFAAELMRVVFPEASRRATGEEAQEAQGRDLKGTPGLCVQVKETAAPQPLAAHAEAVAAALPGEMPVALVRQCRRGATTPTRAVLSMRDFLLLVLLRERFVACFPRRLEEIEAELDEKLAALAEDAELKARLG